MLARGSVGRFTLILRVDQDQSVGRGGDMRHVLAAD
jgi:hypothetical protein